MWIQQIARYAVLVVITVVAVGAMIVVSGRDESALEEAKERVTAPVPIAAQIMPLVAVERVAPARHEVVVRYSGKIRPWESYAIGFEIGGRIAELGVDQQGQPLDDGSRVSTGQLLARLDDRVFAARRNEAVARFEQTSSDLGRARQIRQGGSGAITEAEFQQYLTDHALAKAQLDVATKQLEETLLTSPVDATISRRLVAAGESVSPNQVVFELVEDHQVLLVVDVPEREVRALEERLRAVVQARQSGQDGDPEARVFRARVQLESRTPFGERLPQIDAEVYRIAQVADSRTGLFEVEIRIDNTQRLLRPGMVATADLVVDRISAYRIPETAALFRGSEVFVYGVEEVTSPVQVMFWEIDQAPLATAQRVELTQWIDQGDHLLIPTNSAQLNTIVVRGQQRLSDGEQVRVVATAGDSSRPYTSPGPEPVDPSVARRRTPVPPVE